MTRAFLFIMLLFLSFPAMANDRADLPLDQFSSIPVLHEGRVKPLESFASIYQKKISGTTINAAHWLAQTLFDPQYAASQPVFKIRNSSLIEMLGLSPDKKNKLYSLEELIPSLAETEELLRELLLKEESELTAEQKSFIAIHKNALAHSQLLKALSPLLPLQLNIPDSISLPSQNAQEGPTWLELKKVETSINERVKTIINQKGEDIDSYTDEEKEIATLAFRLKLFRDSSVNSALFTIVPPQWQGSESWFSPNMLLETGSGSPQAAAYLQTWQDMAAAWRTGDSLNWQKLTKQAYDQATSMANDDGLQTRLALEKFYNSVQPFNAATCLYILGLFILGAHILSRQDRFYKAGLSCAVLASVAHMAGIILRILILERPPVGSLYESLLFVSAIIALCGLLIEIKRKDALAITGATASALLILLIAPAIAPNGDDLEMLVAVLNTSFWLATHVICITTGYGLCILTSVLSHIFLFSEERKEGLQKNIYILSLTALFFTAFGTVLGGIWADQSWGRFWGWDPKENGALLIVLWLVWLHHGRLGGYLKPLAFNAGMAFLSVIVALAWFGVNLLSVGLHSYGFISGIAAGLALFCTFEIVTIGWLWHRAQRKQVSHAA